jgi:hypothetical protein
VAGRYPHVVLTGFRNYLLFYCVAGDALQVLRVLHAAQDYTRFFHEDDDRC